MGSEPVSQLSPGLEHEASSERPVRIRLADVTLVIDGNEILTAVSLDVRDKEVLSIIGPSGCGKTTLLNVIAGLVTVQAGTVTVDEQPITQPGSDRVMVFQDDAVFPWLTVWRNIDYGLRIKGLAQSERDERIRAILSLVGLVGRENSYPRQLSGGMRKRVDLGRALAVEPTFLLMDEPYGSLDAMTKQRLQVEFLRIHERTQMTTLFVTHDLEEALFLGDRVVVMSANPGRIRSVLDVPFPHPRPVDLKRAEEFQRLRGELGAQLGIL